MKACPSCRVPAPSDATACRICGRQLVEPPALRATVQMHDDHFVLRVGASPEQLTLRQARRNAHLKLAVSNWTAMVLLWRFVQWPLPCLDAFVDPRLLGATLVPMRKRTLRAEA